MFWLILASLLPYSCTCSVNDAKLSYKTADDFPLIMQQETKKPVTDISEGLFADVPASLGFEDRHLVARPLALVYAEDFYLGPLEQPAWIRETLARLAESILDRELDPALLAESFPEGLVTAVNTVLSGFENLQEVRFSRAPEEATPFVTLDFMLLAKDYRIPGQCIVDTGNGKLLHIVVAEADEKISREQNGEFDPLEDTRKTKP